MAVSPIKPEFPALLPDGFHPMSVAALRQLCVHNFATSITRRGIMGGLEKIIKKLSDAGIVGELWIDGSFVSQKIDPSDADITFAGRL